MNTQQKFEKLHHALDTQKLSGDVLEAIILLAQTEQTPTQFVDRALALVFPKEKRAA